MKKRNAALVTILGIVATVLSSAGVATASEQVPQTSLANEPYSVSYQAGLCENGRAPGRGGAGKVLGGTEFMNAVEFQSRLFAGVGYQGDKPPSGDNSPQPSAQVLVLDHPQPGIGSGHWKEALCDRPQNADGRRFRRTTALLPVTFHKDYRGNDLVDDRRQPLAVRLLIAGFDVFGGNSTALSIRDASEPGHWTLVPFAGRSVRAMIQFGESVVLGTGSMSDDSTPGAIIVGGYDPESPGHIRWREPAEFTDFVNRVTSLAIANDKLYFTAKPGLYEGTPDPASPGKFAWRKVGTFPLPSFPANPDYYRNNNGLRGLTPIPDGRPGAPMCLLGVLEGIPGTIYKIRLEPPSAANPLVDTVSEETADRLARLAFPGQFRLYVIAAYNGMPKVTDAVNRKDYWLIGLQLRVSADGHQTSAWFISRDTQGRYQLHEVPQLPGLAGVPPSELGLRAIRTITVSPFPEDRGAVIYLGGFDKGTDFGPAKAAGVHNTAWLYRVGIHTALSR